MIVLGTSGYHFTDWSGVFYPADLPKASWLRYYSQQFRAVEINSTYYGVPKIDTVRRWSGETPDDFHFLVKLHGDSTHKRERGGEEVAELLDVLEPLTAAGKLRGLLAQFPASFHASAESSAYLETLAGRTRDLPLFVEFRHRSWDRDDAVDLCRRLGLGWVAVDLPPIGSLMGARPAVTGNLAYVRFHGRNAAAWYHPERGDRYDWDYSERELREWVARIQALTGRAELSYLFFNNCHAGHAIKSALLMKEILQQEFEVM